MWVGSGSGMGRGAEAGVWSGSGWRGCQGRVSIVRGGV